MINGSTLCYPNVPQGNNIPIYGGVSEEVNLEPNSSHPTSFLYNLSVIKDKVHQVQSLATIFLSPENHAHHPESTAVAIPTMATLIQEIIVTASSMMFSCQQMSLGSSPNKIVDVSGGGGGGAVVERGPSGGFFSTNPHDTVDDHQWYGDSFNNNCNNSRATEIAIGNNSTRVKKTEGPQGLSYDIIELDAADLLAKYTHYCQVCGKGFKRDANLRMHMRAHGDEYKSSAALSNPLKTHNISGENTGGIPRKYSCPHEGCRWNKNHAKFQPLKSMICVKNHYKRSHCPKMYVCKRCNRKQFSVLSDLRTHEKHCGDLKWQCSCGTTFSRKDKLMGHVALFVGHTPAVN